MLPSSFFIFFGYYVYVCPKNFPGFYDLEHRGEPSLSSPIRSDCIPVGFLHSFSGALASSERPLLYAEMLAVEEINSRGGVLGREIRPELYDGASQSGAFVSCAERILGTDCRTIFGCWTSASRKAVRPLVEKAGALLWYPVHYEGLEESPNIVYTGNCPNQQMLPALNWLTSHSGNRLYLIGSDYVYPRTLHILIRSEIERREGEIVGEAMIPPDAPECPDCVYRDILEHEPSAIISTLNAGNTVDFVLRCRERGIDAREIPVIHLDASETEMRAAGNAAEGHLTCWPYLQKLDTPANAAFLSRFRTRYAPGIPCSAAMVAAYVQIHLWAQACERAGTTDPAALSAALDGISFDGPGGRVTLSSNHHASLMSHIGRYGTDGEFSILWSSDGPIPPTPWQGVEHSHSRFRKIVRGALGYLSEEIFRSATLEEKLLKRTEELEATNRKLRREIAERGRAEENLRKSEERFQTLFRRAPTAMAFVSEDGAILDVNDRFVELTGYTLSDVPDMSTWEALAYPDAEMRRYASESWFSLLHALREKSEEAGKTPRRFIVRCADGNVRILECFASLLDKAVLMGMNDITEQNSALESLQQLKESLEIRVAGRTAELETANRRLRMASMEDALTKLANRRWFNTTMDREIRRARRTGDPLSLLMIDVDFFKQYNDRYGHIKGDACLKKIGAALRDTFRRAEDLPCRYGGEEFAVILPGVAAEDALALAERLRRKVERLLMPHDASSVAPVVTISAGIATEQKTSYTMDQIIDRADQALYKAKSDGRNRVFLWK